MTTDEELYQKRMAKRASMVEGQIAGIYKEAADEMSATVTDYFKQFEKRDAEQQKLLESGEITKDEYTQWRLAQMGRGERYQALRDKLAGRYTNANEEAMSYVNDNLAWFYADNRNYTAYQIEQTGADVDFALWDEHTVRRLVSKQPDLMPYYPKEKAVKRGIDLAYGKQQITKSVTSGILQGKSVYKIADDLQKRIETMNRESAIRSARTAFTEAENAGRLDEYYTASRMGINTKKRWVAAIDDRTRPTHLEADGQTVNYSQAFAVGAGKLNYPGDPRGDPKEIYNCRCTMIPIVDDTDMSDAQRNGDMEMYEKWLENNEANKKSKELESLIKGAENAKIDYKKVDRLESALSEQQIIEKLAGGDMTGGSCASLALAYAANKAGYDVTDYRGGSSQAYIASNYVRMTEKEDSILPSQVFTARSQVTAGNKALKAVQQGEEYILCAGKHAAVVRKTDDGTLQYLEMQSNSSNGWTDFNGNPRYTLSWRFGCSRTGANYTAALTNIKAISENAGAVEILGYINTNTGAQKKGDAGSVK